MKTALVVLSILIIIIAIVILILELRKPRFSREIVPLTRGMVYSNGVPVDPEQLPRNQYGGMKIKYRLWPPAKAEERDVIMQYPGYMQPVVFRIRAVRGGGFVIDNLSPFQHMGDKITFDGLPYDVLIRKPKVFTSRCVFKYYYYNEDEALSVTILQEFTIRS